MAATAPPIPDIDLVEDERRHVGDFAGHDFDGEREARQLSAGSNPRDRAQRLLRVARHAKLHLFQPLACRRGERHERHFEAAALHRQRLHCLRHLALEFRRGEPPLSAELLGQRFPRRLGVGGAPREAFRVGALRERHELGLGIVAQGGKRLGPDAVLPRDVVDRGLPRFDPRELGRVDVELCEVAAQRARRLVELDSRGLDQRDDLAQRGIVSRAAVQLHRQRRQPARERTVAVGDFLFRLARCLDERRRIRKARLQLRRRRPFVGGRAERVQFLQSRRERLAQRNVRRIRRRCRVARLDRSAPIAEGVGAGGRERRESAEGVEQLPLRIGAGQRLVGVLTVEIDQHFADRLLLRERCLAAVDPRAALSLRIQHATQQQRVRVVIACETFVREPRRDVVAATDVEHRRELGARSTGSQLPRLEAVAEQESQRVEQDRLAGAGLAGQHREAALKLELERLDDDEISDGK